MIEAAYGEPRLRVLLRFPRHGCLGNRNRTRRNSQFPWSNDLPFIAGSAPCTFSGPSYSSVREEGLTPKKAAALVVANPPLDCGPACDGPWPPPDSHAD